MLNSSTGSPHIQDYLTFYICIRSSSTLHRLVTPRVITLAMCWLENYVVIYSRLRDNTYFQRYTGQAQTAMKHNLLGLNAVERVDM